MLNGVDIAGSYQAGFSVAQAKREGFSFVACKVTEGLSLGQPWDATNKQWANRWISDCFSQDVVPGAYHWLKNGNGAAQADYFLNELNKITGRGAEGVLIQLDDEDNADIATYADFVHEWNRLTGGHPYINYTGKWWWDAPGRGWNGAFFTPYLWDSHYLWDASVNLSRAGTPHELVPQVPSNWWTTTYGNWRSCTFLQYTSRGSAGGVINNVDLNLFNGSLDDLKTLTGVDMALSDSDITRLLTALRSDLVGIQVGNSEHYLQNLVYLKPTVEGGISDTVNVNFPTSSFVSRLNEMTDILKDLQSRSPSSVTDAQVVTLADRVAEALIANPNNSLTDADKLAVKNVITEVLGKVQLTTHD